MTGCGVSVYICIIYPQTPSLFHFFIFLVFVTSPSSRFFQYSFCFFMGNPLHFLCFHCHEKYLRFVPTRFQIFLHAIYHVFFLFRGGTQCSVAYYNCRAGPVSTKTQRKECASQKFTNCPICPIERCAQKKSMRQLADMRIVRKSVLPHPAKRTVGPPSVLPHPAKRTVAHEN